MDTTRSARAARRVLLCGLAGLQLSLLACATTRQTRSVEESGFLGDYSQLREEGGETARLSYIDPEIDWSQYSAIIIESATIWHNESNSKLSAQDQQALTDALYTAFRETLSQDYEIVAAPAPGVMTLRLAITEAKGARVVGNAVTTVIPQTRLLSSLAGLATDTQVFVGRASIEAELLDSISEERLAAAVDERAGAKTLRGIGGKWKDVENAFAYWAERLRERLAEWRGSE
ncbi:MAG: DUF3313 domain-containing protein [Deltaproteobacteria bacterium]|nr:MAG: DUF3313 domain-containing protein [Deltaproteobacteria bacterium]